MIKQQRTSRSSDPHNIIRLKFEFLAQFLPTSVKLRSYFLIRLYLLSARSGTMSPMLLGGSEESVKDPWTGKIYPSLSPSTLSQILRLTLFNNSSIPLRSELRGVPSLVGSTNIINRASLLKCPKTLAGLKRSVKRMFKKNQHRSYQGMRPRGARSRLRNQHWRRHNF
jgi:hypothetical protein